MKLPAHKGSLYLTHNDHKSAYQSALEWCEDLNAESLATWQSEEHKQRAIATDEIWTLQWYPDTPIGFFSVAAPTLDELLAFAEEVERERK